MPPSATLTLPPLSVMGTLRWDVVSRLLPRSGARPGAAAITVLEVGCGQGAVATRLATQYDYLGVEPDAASCEVAAARLAALGRGEARCGALEVVEPDRVFDLVVSFEVIEHIEDDEEALRAWVARLRPGGTLILSTPAYQARFGPSDEAVGHFRRYEPADLRALMQRCGLEDVQVVHYGMPVGYLIEAVRNAVLRRRAGSVAEAEVSMAERTGRSGRFFQPSRAVGAVIAIVLAPLRVIQRLFPARGPTLVARGRRSAT